MATPDFQSMALPILRVLADGNERELEAIRDALAERMKLSAADREELLPSGKQTRFANRANWSCIYLTEAGLLRWVRRGVYVITDRGLALLDDPPARIDVAFLMKYPEFVAWRAKKKPNPKPDDNDDDDEDEEIEDNDSQYTPLEIPLNLILYGPPGTGKTFELTSKLIRKFQRAPTDADSIAEIAAKLPWGPLTAIALHDLGGKSKVPELEDHPLLRAKHARSGKKTQLSQSLWAILQRHTIEASKTVSYKQRAPDRYFDKIADSTWILADKLPEELREVAAQLKAPTPDAPLKDYTVVTFHQAYGYEDFIEGIRPNAIQAGDDDDADLTYRLEPGTFMKAVREALLLAGSKHSLDELCRLPHGERQKQFRNARPYAIFIDEINRGNVARIFGELITLLEADKRLGAENELVVELPYSKTLFGVPPNLYVIGTMNTADRSIEALDTALRRRFEFQEMPPRPDLLAFKIADVIDPEKMLAAINRRLEQLYDRDHCIGHAYFLGLKNDPSLKHLKHVFRHKIVPLLQEYFFGDWGKIGLVLGKDFVQRRPAGSALFADFDHDEHDTFAEIPRWDLVDLDGLGPEAFQRIYTHASNA